MTTGLTLATLACGYRDYEKTGAGTMPNVLSGFNRRIIKISWFAFTRILQREAKKAKMLFWLQQRKTLRSISPVALATVNNSPADII
jgi:hypothetical protein